MIKKNILLVGCVLLLAAFLRLDSLDYIEFKRDEAANSFLAVSLAQEGVFPLSGDISSTGAYHPPALVYLLAPPAFFSRNPILLSAYIALLNVLAVFLCFLFVRRFFSARAALISAAFFAVNPWIILYSRKIWAEDFLPLFMVGCLYSLYKVVIEKCGEYVLVGAFCLAVLVQLHASSLYAAFAVLFVLIATRPKVGWGYYAAGLMISAVLWLPYIVFEAQNNFLSYRVLSSWVQAPFSWRPENTLLPFSLATAHGFLGVGDFNVFDAVQVVFLLASVFCLVFLGRQERYFVLLLCFLVPYTFLLFSKIPVDRCYFVFLFPLQFIVLGVSADFLCCRIEALSSRYSRLLIAVVGVLFIYQMSVSFHFNQYLKTHSQIDWMGYGPPLKYRVDEIRAALKAGHTGHEEIHRLILQGKDGSQRFKYDPLATQYLVENMKWMGE